MKPKVSIIVLVDAVGALSDRTLHNGNLSLVDDSSFGSLDQGTPGLTTAVLPGQAVQWTAIAVDVQSPVEIQNIEFLSDAPDGLPGAPAVPGYAAPPSYDSGVAVAIRPEAPAHTAQAAPAEVENYDLLLWEGIVPVTMAPGIPYRYRLTLKIHEGANSVLSIDSPALLRV